jgi:hypothetical protein
MRRRGRDGRAVAAPVAPACAMQERWESEVLGRVAEKGQADGKSAGRAPPRTTCKLVRHLQQVAGNWQARVRLIHPGTVVAGSALATKLVWQQGFARVAGQDLQLYPTWPPAARASVVKAGKYAKCANFAGAVVLGIVGPFGNRFVRLRVCPRGSGMAPDSLQFTCCAPPGYFVRCGKRCRDRRPS